MKLRFYGDNEKYKEVFVLEEFCVYSREYYKAYPDIHSNYCQLDSGDNESLSNIIENIKCHIKKQIGIYSQLELDIQEIKLDNIVLSKSKSIISSEEFLVKEVDSDITTFNSDKVDIDGKEYKVLEHVYNPDDDSYSIYINYVKGEIVEKFTDGQNKLYKEYSEKCVELERRCTEVNRLIRSEVNRQKRYYKSLKWYSFIKKFTIAEDGNVRVGNQVFNVKFDHKTAIIEEVTDKFNK